MPNFHNVKAASATSVETASELFRLHWGMYRKILKDDYEERSMLLDHVRETERPETVSNWLRLGKEAGFSSAVALYSEPTGLYTLFSYS